MYKQLFAILASEVSRPSTTSSLSGENVVVVVLCSSLSSCGSLSHWSKTVCICIYIYIEAH